MKSGKLILFASEVCFCFANSRTKISKPVSEGSSSTTPKARIKIRNRPYWKALLSQAYLSKKLQCIFLEPTAVRSNLLSINMRESEKAIASGCRQQAAQESNPENRTWRSKIKCIGINVIRNCPITDNYMYLHDKNNQSDNNCNFLHGKK